MVKVWFRGRKIIMELVFVLFRINLIQKMCIIMKRNAAFLIDYLCSHV